MAADDQLTPDEVELLAMMDDTSPSDDQKKLLAAFPNYAYLGPPSDRSENGGVPLGQSPDDIANTRINVINFSDNDSGQTTNTDPEISFTIDGKNDPVVKEVMSRYAPMMANDHSPTDRKNAAIAAMTEIAAIKAQKSGQSNKHTKSLPAPAKKTKSDAPKVRVVIPFGQGLGAQEFRYDDVVIGGNALVLIVDQDTGSGAWIPPDPDPAAAPRVFDFQIEGLDAVVRAYPLGLTYKYSGKVHYVLLIDRG